MEIKLSLNEYADLPFLKKLLSQLKGVASFEITDNDKTYSLEDIETSKEFKKVIEKSRQQIRNGQVVEHSQELMDSVFRKK